jgi:hypothetical protein
MEYQRVAAKDLVGWEDGVRRGLHAKCGRKGQLTNFKLALREVVTYMTVRVGSVNPQHLSQPGFNSALQLCPMPWVMPCIHLIQQAAVQIVVTACLPAVDRMASCRMAP